MFRTKASLVYSNKAFENATAEGDVELGQDSVKTKA